MGISISKSGKEPKPETKKRAILRQNFSETTSCHGIIKIYQSVGWKSKVFWIFLVLAVFAALVAQITILTMEYFEYKTSTEISEEFVDSLPIPAVTICNFNKYFDVTSEEASDLNKLSQNLFADGKTSFDYFNTLGSNFSLKNFMISKGWRIQRDLTLFLCRAGISDPECEEANFEPILTQSLGLCWTFKSNYEQAIKGIGHGFHVILNVETDKYTENPIYGNMMSGIAFHVHPPYVPPEIESIGQAVGVGMWGVSSIQNRKIKRMYEPWGVCRVEKEQLVNYPIYSLAACMNECQDKSIIATCQCRDPFTTNYDNIRECTPTEVMACAAPTRYSNSQNLKPRDCDCYQPCNEVTFEQTLTYTTFPNPVASAYLSSLLNVSQSYIKENILGLSVFFNSLSVSSFTESKTISEIQLLSNYGGQLGLWAGISVVTVIEFFEFFIKMLKTLKKKGNLTTTPINVESGATNTRSNFVEPKSSL